MCDSTFPADFYSQPTDASGSEADAAPESMPATLGDYDLLEKLGEGGMGVVYRARQRSANRMVALKVIRPNTLASLGPKRQQEILDRFRIEAQAAANLEHNNIVTVYDVGEADGQRYFSMRLVDGESLVDMVREGPLENRVAARYMEPVCRAVHDAHEHGVLHRDIKPQNILVDTESDSALVADFGLAKLNEQQDELTQVGDVMGTPQYMSPEQATDSAHVTAQSDVYSLGATLYHLLTGRPAFQGPTPIDTLRQVLDKEPVAPSALNPAVDKDLNTICLKCLEKDPAKRYDSAQDLADELQRYLAGKPILARPLSPVGRLWRWSRRNRLVAASALAALVGLSGGLVTTTVAYFKTSAALQMSEESLGHARSAVDEFFTRVSEETLLDQPGLQPLRHDLLKLARTYYQTFLDQRGDDPEIQDELAEAQFRVGRITAEVESPAAALRYYDQALDIQYPLVKAHPDESSHQISLANTLNAKGEALFRIGRLDESFAVFQQSFAVRQEIFDRDPNDREAARKLANTRMNISVVLRGQFARSDETAKLTDAFEQMETAQKIRLSVKRNNADARLLRDLAKGYFNLGICWFDRSDQLAETTDGGGGKELASAAKNFSAAVDLLNQLLTVESTLTDQHLLGTCYFSLAQTQLGNPLAKENFGRALSGAVPLAAANPKIDKFHAMVGRIELELGDLYAQEGNHKEALIALRAADAVFRKLVARDPATLQYRHDLITTLQLLAVSENPEAQPLAHLKRLRELLVALVEQYPNMGELADAADEAATLINNK